MVEIKLLRCQTCGGDLSFIDKAVVARCVYCGSLHSVTDSGSNGQKLGALLILAEQCQVEGKRAEAHAYYNRAIELDPANAQAWIGRGSTEAMFSEHSFDKAVEFSADPAAVRGRIVSILAIDSSRQPNEDGEVYAYLARLAGAGISAEAALSVAARFAKYLSDNEPYFVEHFAQAEQIERLSGQIARSDNPAKSVVDNYRFQRHLQDEKQQKEREKRDQERRTISYNRERELKAKRRLRIVGALAMIAVISIVGALFGGLAADRKRRVVSDDGQTTMIYTADNPGGAAVLTSDDHPFQEAIQRVATGGMVGAIVGAILVAIAEQSRKKS